MAGGPVILNVAEKNDAAKSIAGILSQGHAQRREGLSPYNKIYAFRCDVGGAQAEMLMTSVSGHLLSVDFPPAYAKWASTPFEDLFHAPLETKCPENNEPIKRTLEREARRAQRLILWTDCDREGEAIGFEVLSVCRAVNPRIQVERARFSEITAAGIWRALRNLVPPDARLNDAVLTRSELDLRTGAAFTRLQTLRLRGKLPAAAQGPGQGQVISYGSCQFPTLGFVVRRYKAHKDFVPEDFWKLRLAHTKDGVRTEFGWERVRLFAREAVEALRTVAAAASHAHVTSVREKPKSRWRPLPLDTVELEKLGVRKLRLSAKATLETAEKLYQKGFISYPRTETNIFPKELDLTRLVQAQANDAHYGAFAADVLQRGVDPRRGAKSDQAHPPIHPLKASEGGGFQDDTQRRVFDLVCRHFLACVSRDARGSETIVQVNMGGEGFTGTGLVIIDRGYLDVYPFDMWNAKQVGHYQPHETFVPDSLDVSEGRTTAPALLTEADLITLMDKHGIGTDATHAQHIDTIQTRHYAGLNQEHRFLPGFLGLGLVEGYERLGYQMAGPDLRSEFEADLVAICQGRKRRADVLRTYVDKYFQMFTGAQAQFEAVEATLRRHFAQAPAQPQAPLPPAQRGGARGRGVARGGRGGRGAGRGGRGRRGAP